MPQKTSVLNSLSLLKSSPATNNDDVFTSNAPSFKMKSKIHGLQNAINTKSALNKGYIPKLIIFLVRQLSTHRFKKNLEWCGQLEKCSDKAKDIVRRSQNLKKSPTCWHLFSNVKTSGRFFSNFCGLFRKPNVE